MLRQLIPGKQKEFLRKHIPWTVWNWLRMAAHYRDFSDSLPLIVNANTNLSLVERLAMVKQIYTTSFEVEGPHLQSEMLELVQTILTIPPHLEGVVVEAGCFKGSSTAKLSLAADAVGRELVVFDSFQGIPPNSEEHGKNIYGEDAGFAEGDYCGSLPEVKNNVANWGKIQRCRFIEGWFEDTMPHFKEKVAVAFVDVDLASSTRTCIKHLYPLLEPGAVLISHDGHLPLVLALYDDDAFWENEVGCKKPEVEKIQNSKLLKVVKK